MSIEAVVSEVRDWIEDETGLRTEQEFTGNGVAIALLSPTGWILGTTCVMLSVTRKPLVFVNNRGFFTGHAGMTLASQFRSQWDKEDETISPNVETVETVPTPVIATHETPEYNDIPYFLRKSFGADDDEKVDTLELSATMRVN